jgi:hypothetical protein
MPGLEATVLVLDQMQVLDQEIAAPRPRAKQCADVRERGIVHHAALRPAFTPRARRFRSHLKIPLARMLLVAQSTAA